jgi:hypothetical protein
MLHASAHQFRSVVLAHLGVSEIPGRILLAPSPNLVAGHEHNLAALDGLGLEVDAMIAVVRLVGAYTRTRAGKRERTDPGTDRRRRRIGARRIELDAGRRRRDRGDG